MLYTLTAFVLSFAWLGALTFAPGLGTMIQEDLEKAFSLPKEVLWALFPIISVFIALAFKRWILACRRWRAFLPASTLPFIGSLAIALACGIASHASRVDHDFGFRAALFYAVSYTVMAFWVVVPMGLLSQILLLAAERISNHGKTEQAAPSNGG